MSVGILFLVVGPSGAGKDTLISEARRLLDADGVTNFVFPQRAITRGADAGAESHLAFSEEDFLAEERRGGFTLSWRAHGLCYGIPASIADELSAGRHVVVNVSRHSVAEAALRFSRIRVILISAPPELLRARLKSRQRETALEQDARIARTAELAADHAAEIVNDGTIADGGRKLLELLYAGANGLR